MGVALYLIGKTAAGAEAGEVLDRARRVIADEAGDLVERLDIGAGADGQPLLTAKLHPIAEELELGIDEGGQVTVSAKTSPVGPGYHIFVCQLLHKIGQVAGVRWAPRDEAADTGDPTGYFHTGKRDRLDGEMLAWIADVAQRVLALPPSPAGKVQLSMPTDHAFDGDGAVLTPLGPRDRAWLERAAHNPADGRDFFPWWEEGVGPETMLGRALCLMWSDVRWRPPLDDAETRRLQLVARLLEDAQKLDASLDFPWREWHELLGFLGQKSTPLADVIARRGARVVPGTPLVGYRRRTVYVNLPGGWRITIPGSFSESFDAEGTFCAGEPPRAMYVSSFTYRDKGGQLVPAAELLSPPDAGAGERVEHATGAQLGRAVVKSVDGGFELEGEAAVAGSLASVTIAFADARDRDWAIATFRTLQYGAQG
jgi:hypothetical protein